MHAKGTQVFIKLERLTTFTFVLCNHNANYFLGGPLVTAGSGSGVTAGQIFELIGVVSWGAGCAEASYPRVYARVTKQLDWIADTTATGWSTCPRE